ncbi:phosphate starvation-inducible protein PhoH [Desulfonauticus submarinus]|uniref:PhoH-like protein n=1 Tax=Desulfonauticus submarinus TaxID=206665 RepID=A0A1H0B476_9BACT|nr:PhoH family protein [Desulfonauticus submarinus]SDN40478.1 phosphate starvation-inducible protein PhoH [Desulfonauticus submarinus]
MKELTLEFQDTRLLVDLFGPLGSHLDIIHKTTGVTLENRGNTILLKCKNKENLLWAKKCLLELYNLLKRGYKIYPEDVESSLKVLAKDKKADLHSFFKEEILTVAGKKVISPRTISQKRYLKAIKQRDLVFAIGPAGTGKTYLAVAVAVSHFLQHKVKRIILTRPAVEAGERLGFLPGDLVQKVNPYLRPLYDALNDMLDFKKVQEMLDSGQIEVAPLAFMRGRTLNNAFIILDEAQNTTSEQMKMFLTRMGFNSKMVVTGDITQVDLPDKKSGLIEAIDVLSDLNDVEFIYFDQKDVIRHKLVGRIVEAYDKFTGKVNGKGNS